MEKIVNRISISYSDPDINAFLRSLPFTCSVEKPYFNQNEEMFVRLGNPITIPSLPVHHDVLKSKPTPQYLKNLLLIIKSLAKEIPCLFSDLQYYFDPAEVIHPCFFRVYKIKEKTYLYLLRIDLSYRAYYGNIINKGSNDLTPSYKTDAIFFEADIIPLNGIQIEENRFSEFIINQIVSQNWIGETGRGYMVQGIWIDHELTKFFSKLFLPNGFKNYPYYPFACKYRTLCHTLIDPSPEGRKKGIPRIHNALQTITPWMDFIQKLLKSKPFDPEMKEFRSLKSSVPSYWNNAWESYTFKAYLNDADMKEFSFEV